MNPPQNIGAFFDLDGTLVPFPSLEWRFISFLVARKELDGAAGTRWLNHFAKNALSDSRAAIEANKMHFDGLRSSLADDWRDLLAVRPIVFFSGAIERIHWHAQEGHSLFLVSGTIEPLARALARALPNCVDVSASTMEERGGHWTGRLASEHMSGAAKARAVRRLATQYAIDLDRSYAYGNSETDAAMLTCVGNPMAVNPSAGLRHIARSRGWRMCRWRKQGAAAPDLKLAKLFTREAR